MATTDIKFEAQQLYNNRLLEDREQALLFESSLQNIEDEKVVNHIPILCQAFDDDTEQYDIMYSVVHAIERYHKIASPKQAITEFTNSIHLMLPHAQNWVNTLLFGILNHDLSRRILGEILFENKTDTRELVVKVLKNISERSPERFQEKVNEVINFAN